MSDDVLRLIPADQALVPSASAHAAAVARLAELLPEGHTCRAEVYDDLKFIDCGENLEAVICPNCHGRIELDFAQDSAVIDWWHQACDELETKTVAEAQVAMPCCGRQVPFTTLHFDWPAGFARFELSIYDPDRWENLSEDELSSVEQALGCKLLQVRAHY